MAAGCFRFGRFTYCPTERQLLRGIEPLAVSSRYLDALALFLREPGRLITKERFLDEVWEGVPVTDEALTQCIRTLRRQLGDDAARPQFIETVPKHGYRFIASVEWVAQAGAPRSPSPPILPTLSRISGIAALGGTTAGIGGGLLYGLAASPAAHAPTYGAASMLLVMLALNMLVGFVGGLGVGAGIAASMRVRLDRWQVTAAGGMAGGFVIGAMAKLIGLDAFSLLFGRSPSGMTGPAEGAILGAAVGLAVWLARHWALSVRKSAVFGGASGAIAGLFVPLFGGHLLGGSLQELTDEFAGARFRLGAIGRMWGEQGFGRMSEISTAVIEGCLFGFCVAGALAVQRRAADEKAARGDWIPPRS